VGRRRGRGHPGFGLTSLLDATGAALPPGVETTYPTVTVGGADALARLLRVAGRHADPALDAPLADYVTAKLRRATAGVAHTRRSGVRGRHCRKRRRPGSGTPR
jgi:hypothetical protein